MEHLLQKSKCSIFHIIFKYIIFQRRHKAFLWSNGLKELLFTHSSDCWVILHAFCRLLIFFAKLNFLKCSFRNKILSDIAECSGSFGRVLDKGSNGC